jgi:hypothetical protein
MNWLSFHWGEGGTGNTESGSYTRQEGLARDNFYPQDSNAAPFVAQAFPKIHPQGILKT